MSSLAWAPLACLQITTSISGSVVSLSGEINVKLLIQQAGVFNSTCAHVLWTKYRKKSLSLLNEMLSKQQGTDHPLGDWTAQGVRTVAPLLWKQRWPLRMVLTSHRNAALETNTLRVFYTSLYDLRSPTVRLWCVVIWHYVIQTVRGRVGPNVRCLDNFNVLLVLWQAAPEIQDQ